MCKKFQKILLTFQRHITSCGTSKYTGTKIIANTIQQLWIRQSCSQLWRIVISYCFFILVNPGSYILTGFDHRFKFVKIFIITLKIWVVKGLGFSTSNGRFFWRYSGLFVSCNISRCFFYISWASFGWFSLAILFLGLVQEAVNNQAKKYVSFSSINKSPEETRLFTEQRLATFFILHRIRQIFDSKLVTT